MGNQQNMPFGGRGFPGHMGGKMPGQGIPGMQRPQMGPMADKENGMNSYGLSPHQSNLGLRGGMQQPGMRPGMQQPGMQYPGMRPGMQQPGMRPGM
jgi:hypothetical protein